MSHGSHARGGEKSFGANGSGNPIPRARVASFLERDETAMQALPMLCVRVVLVYVYGTEASCLACPCVRLSCTCISFPKKFLFDKCFIEIILNNFMEIWIVNLCIKIM